MTPSVYVAGSSDELDRAHIAMTIIRAEGWKVAYDWVALIRAVGVANPVDAPRERRADWAGAELAAVRGATAVWLLAPMVGHARGAFVELGFAIASRVPVVVSGPHHACSIFTALAAEVTSDAEGLAMLRGWLRP